MARLFCGAVTCACLHYLRFLAGFRVFSDVAPLERDRPML
jgi:hypothetical protein